MVRALIPAATTQQWRARVAAKAGKQHASAGKSPKPPKPALTVQAALGAQAALRTLAQFQAAAQHLAQSCMPMGPWANAANTMAELLPAGAVCEPVKFLPAIRFVCHLEKNSLFLNANIWVVVEGSQNKVGPKRPTMNKKIG